MVIDLLVASDTPADAQILLHVYLRSASSWGAPVTSLLVSAQLSSCIHTIVVLLDHSPTGALATGVTCIGLLAHVGSLVGHLLSRGPSRGALMRVGSCCHRVHSCGT